MRLFTLTKPMAQGFSLVEMLITVSILGIVAAMAVPAFVRNQKDFEAQNVANVLKNFFIESRQEAIIYHNPVTLCIADNTGHCVINDGSTLLSFLDRNDNHDFDAETDTLYSQVHVDPTYGRLVNGAGLSRAYIKLKAGNGRPIGFMGSFKYCPGDGNTDRAFKITFSEIGNIKYKKHQEEATGCNS